MMDHYLRKCPNCGEMIGNKLRVCPDCGVALEKSGGFERKERSARRGLTQRYKVSIVGTFSVLVVVPVFLYGLLIVLTNDAGGALNCVMIPCANIAAGTLTLALCLPVAKWMNNVFRNRGLRWRRWILSPLGASVPLAIGAILALLGYGLVFLEILEGDIVSQFISRNEQDLLRYLFIFLFLGGFPVLLGGSLLWFFLRVTGGLQKDEAAKQSRGSFL